MTINTFGLTLILISVINYCQYSLQINSLIKRENAPFCFMGTFFIRHDVRRASCVMTSLLRAPGKMAAVQDGSIELDTEKETKPEILSDGSANISGNAGSGVLSSSPPAGGAQKPEDQQTLIAVLQFLRRNKLTESVDILKREAGLSDDQENSKAPDAGGKGDGDAGDTNALLSRVSITSAAAPQSAPLPLKS